MEMKIYTENRRVPITVIHIDGNLDSATYKSFQKKAEELIKGGSRHILIDLEHTHFVSSAGFRAVHQIFMDLNAIHPDANLTDEEMRKGIGNGTYKSPYLKLANLSKETKMVFTTTGFDMYLEFYDDVKTALASF